MGIRAIELNTESWNPGEHRNQDSDYTHITISYDISGNRYKIDQYLKGQLKDCHYCQLIECVNTTLYMQKSIEIDEKSKDETERSIDEMLREELKHFFVNTNNLSGEKVTAYCMVGNVRAFAYEVDA